MPSSTRVRIPKNRIESLTDLIFGLALSIGAISLISKPPTKPADVITNLATFGFSFLILIHIWFQYTNIMSLLPLETAETMLLNAILLFLVSVEPYLLGLLTFEASKITITIFASQIYALDLAGLTAIICFFTHQLTIERRRVLDPEQASRYRRIRNAQFLSAALFAVSAFPIFWAVGPYGTPWRFYIWYGILVFVWISRLTSRAESFINSGSERSV